MSPSRYQGDQQIFLINKTKKINKSRYAHPYLPGLHTSIHIEDFLWTGEGEGEGGQNGLEEEVAMEGQVGPSMYHRPM